MRKFVLAGVIATLGVAMLAIPASASFDRHFNVIEKGVSGEPVGEHAFRFKNKLVQPHNRDNRVGSDQGICREAPHRKLKVPRRRPPQWRDRRLRRYPRPRRSRAGR